MLIQNGLIKRVGSCRHETERMEKSCRPLGMYAASYREVSNEVIVCVEKSQQLLCLVEKKFKQV